MPELSVKCPAKINLTLEIVNKREDGFHNIKTVMQSIDLYDYLKISVEDDSDFSIILSGTSSEIPYNEKNLVYKAAKIFFDTAKISNKKVDIFIEKNIPVAAGLAGGSTDAAGTFYGLNKIFNNILSEEKINELCATLGSDLNFCLKGGCRLATSRGEILEELPCCDFNVTLIKPKSFGISAKEAYTKYAALLDKKDRKKTEKLVADLKNNSLSAKMEDYLYNDLERAVIDDYSELQEIKNAYPCSIMSGSGSTFFAIGELENCLSQNKYWFNSNVKTTPNGVC